MIVVQNVLGLPRRLRFVVTRKWPKKQMPDAPYVRHSHTPIAPFAKPKTAN